MTMSVENQGVWNRTQLRVLKQALSQFLSTTTLVIIWWTDEIETYKESTYCHT